MQQAVQLSAEVKLSEVITSAYRGSLDQDLRDGLLPGQSDHFLFTILVFCDVDLFERDPFVV